MSAERKLKVSCLLRSFEKMNIKVLWCSALNSLEPVKLKFKMLLNSISSGTIVLNVEL